MPTYDFLCPNCEVVEEKTHLISEEPVYTCDKCGATMIQQFTPNESGFILKGGTDTIHWREKRNHLKKSEDLKVRQQKWKAASPKVQPNIAGVRQDSWSDCQKMAKEAGLNHESYDPWVATEGNKKIVVPGAGV